METELTKAIKLATHTYKPKMGNRNSPGQAGRTIRYADEVWTPNGIVDSIRFEDYIVSRHEECVIEQCKIEGEQYPNKNCSGCFYRKRGVPEIGMLITAYEIKITKSDFKSRNGHNIDDPSSPIANENYYCMPKELIQQVEDMIPEHVGILSYQNGRLRQYRPSGFLEVPDSVKIMLLYNAMKKWCDGAMTDKEKNIGN